MAITRTGKLNKRLTFVEVKSSKDTISGQDILQNEDVFSCWYDEKQKYSDELSREVGTVLEYTKVIIIRQNQKFEIDSAWLVKMNSDLYEIEKINPAVDLDGFLLIYCRKKE
ncbi:phage head closure protein [Listeria innocua]|uniref:phage head closure protein n=1 Tax=Listeria innocua TaxID=1642 RepID=UPI00162A27A0|nr:phage head closure protein [Listeria innocua]